jgi:NAD(P)H-hydrate epimerase
MTADASFPALSREQVRDVNRIAIDEYGLPGVVLMENAGRNAAAWLRSRQPAGNVAVVCGKGNNAGDGFVIARYLSNWGDSVRVLLACRPEEASGDAAVFLGVIQRAGIEIVDLSAADSDAWRQHLDQADVIVDALLGTGLSGPVREPLVQVIEAINLSKATVLAVDLPSGLDANTGLPLGVCVRADLTATFVARKTGFDQPGASHWTGEVVVCDIGIPRQLLERHFGSA